jgi:flagellar hook-length control protein FliK
MPRLGAVDATLQLSGNRLRLRLTTTATDAASDLRQQMPGLAQGLADAGLMMQSFDVNHES